MDGFWSPLWYLILIHLLCYFSPSNSKYIFMLYNNIDIPSFHYHLFNQGHSLIITCTKVNKNSPTRGKFKSIHLRLLSVTLPCSRAWRIKSLRILFLSHIVKREWSWKQSAKTNGKEPTNTSEISLIIRKSHNSPTATKKNNMKNSLIAD